MYLKTMTCPLLGFFDWAIDQTLSEAFALTINRTNVRNIVIGFMERLRRMFDESLTPWLTGAGSRRLEGTNIGHENAEGMAYVGVRVEPTVRLGRAVEGR